MCRIIGMKKRFALKLNFDNPCIKSALIEQFNLQQNLIR